ncbi:Dam family site-specific DNA-(adenine-N6)-methyltransferase [Candidatus Parcubacteria bacterium]|nr:Dam family site-specific DNA-(adenine-N6)-methyltransferase [Candidatus Parcubacteria bacterium]
MMVRNKQVKPFLKWVGGKTQLLDKLEARLPEKIKSTKVIDCYIESFVGGGALFFYLRNRYQINKAYLIDNNQDLILTYKVIQGQASKLIKELNLLQNKYLKFDDSDRTEFYYKIRTKYNQQKKEVDCNKLSDIWVERASFVIFLNKTCFNGLFRQNGSGGFNVPHGRYKNPKICDSENIKKVSEVLKGARIIRGDFAECRKYAKPGALVYFDPPYRPLNATSSFTGYTKKGFCDNEQMRLAKLCKEFSQKEVYVLLSNSDPTNENKKDSFFDNIYSDFNIQRVLANRMVNCNGDKRGQIRELLIANY